MSSYDSIGARLAVEHATLAAVARLKDDGIESIVLRGPLMAALFYDRNEARTSIDVDLLVEDLPTASAALEQEGYERLVDWTPGMERHAWTHAKENQVSIDLHRTLIGIKAKRPVWQVLARESEPVSLAGGRVRAPVLPAQLMIVALHAAQHGVAAAKTMEDLRRALERFEDPDWRQAANLAHELDATEAFTAGLYLAKQGRELAAGLGLAMDISRETRLRALTPPPTALGLEGLFRRHGRERLSFGFGKLFPPAEFMRLRHPLARRGRAWLLVAYAYRLGWLARWLPKGIRSRRAADRPVKSSSPDEIP